MTDAVPQCRGEHSYSEGNQRPEAMGTSNQHLQTHVAGPTPGPAHVRLPKEKASSVEPLDTRFWHMRKQVLKQVQSSREHPPHPSPPQMRLGKNSSSRAKNLSTPDRSSEFPQEQQLLQQLLASPGRGQEGGLQGCSCKDFLTLQEIGNRYLHALTSSPYVLGTSAQGGKKFNNASFQVKYFYYQNYYISCESSNVTAWCKNSTRVRSYSPHLS